MTGQAADQIVIRPLAVPDIDACVGVLHALPNWFGIESSIQDYGRDLQTLDGFVAEDEGTVAGFVGLKRYGLHAIEINVIGIHPSHRNRGIGSRLLHTVETESVTDQTKLLHMKTLAPSHPDPWYAETRAFWEAKGYIPMDAHLLWGPEDPCQVMVKPFQR